MGVTLRRKPGTGGELRGRGRAGRPAKRHTVAVCPTHHSVGRQSGAGEAIDAVGCKLGQGSRRTDQATGLRRFLWAAGWKGPAWRS